MGGGVNRMLHDIIKKNRYRSFIFEILKLCTNRQTVTWKLLRENILVSAKTLYAILYLLESLDLIKIKNVGVIKLYRATQLANLFLEESGVQ